MSEENTVKTKQKQLFKKVTLPLKIHFIVPPLTSEGDPSTKRKRVGTFFLPLGLAAVAAICELKGHIVKVTDGAASFYNLKEIQKEIDEFKPDIVGMSASFLNIETCHIIAKHIKEIIPQAKVILGGAQTSIFTKQALASKDVDWGIQSEAELVFDELLDALDDNKDFTKIKGLAYKNKFGEICINPKQELYHDINQFPMPARHLFPMEKYVSYPLLRGKRTFSIITSRGCPYQCNFCSSPEIFGQSFRYLNTENAMKEIRHLLDVYRADSLLFYDETFTVNRQRVIELCDAMIKEKISVEWGCFTRVNLVDKELLQKMKLAGCYIIYFGVESGVQRLLDLVKKGFELNTARNAVKLCKEIGIQPWCSFMLGLPSETEEESWQTINFALELDPEYIEFGIFMPWQGTPAYELAKKYGVILNENISDYKTWLDKPFFKPCPNRDPEEVIRTVKKGHKKFYLRPKYIIKKTIDLALHLPPEKIWRILKAGNEMI